MCVGRLTCSPADALRARLAMCGALGRASVNSGAANQRSPNDVDPFHKIPEPQERRTQEGERPNRTRHPGARSRLLLPTPRNRRDLLN